MIKRSYRPVRSSRTRRYSTPVRRVIKVMFTTSEPWTPRKRKVA